MKNISPKFLLIAIAISMSIVLISCGQTNKNTESHSTDTTSNIDQTHEIQVNPLPHAKDFPEATLTIDNISSEKLGTDSAKITVKYNAKNFNLTDQTEHSHHMANSHDGQHIHFILDNSPYVALYKPENTATVPLNTEHYLLSFLSRSFHESIKTKDASKLIKFNISSDGKLLEQPAPTEASLFYSRPKGEYKGADTKSILLDFFLLNTEISPKGNKIKADINGKEFVLDQWIPYEILNLPYGENTIKLSLIDKDGNAITGKNVSVERKINLIAE